MWRNGRIGAINKKGKGLLKKGLRKFLRDGAKFSQGLDFFCAELGEWGYPKLHICHVIHLQHRGGIYFVAYCCIIYAPCCAL